MIELDPLTDLVDPVAIVAFEGWNDAGDAATGVVEHLAKLWGAEVIGAFDPDDYYDFQVNRPTVSTDTRGMRVITWPTTRILAASPPGLDRDVILVRGLEPNLRWRSFCGELLAALDDLGATLVVSMGALLADAPHTRPISVQGSASEPELLDRLKLESSSYEGPTGIVGVFQEMCASQDMPVVSYWAGVPHYVANPPSPKATLALLGRVEDLLRTTIDLGDLAEDALAWEQAIDDMADDDEDIADYVRSLEETRDTTDRPEASGEAIAKKFEEYLQHPDE